MMFRKIFHWFLENIKKYQDFISQINKIQKRKSTKEAIILKFPRGRDRRTTEEIGD